MRWAQPFLICVALSLAATEATAASRGALIWDGEYWTFGYGALEQGLAAGGANPVERASVLPADLSAYNLVIVVLPSSTPDAAATDALVDFVAGGGALVLVSDFEGYAPEPSGIFNAMLTDYDVDARFGPGTIYNCSSIVTTSPHPLMAGVVELHGAASDFIVPGPATEIIVQALAQEPILAVERNIVLLGDSNAINDYVCAPAGPNGPFFANLPAFACDIDGDGVSNGSCDGDDPNDLDPAVSGDDGGSGGEESGGDTTTTTDPTGEPGPTDTGPNTAGAPTDDYPTDGAATGGVDTTATEHEGPAGPGSGADADGCGCDSDARGGGALALLLVAAGGRRRRPR